MPSRLRSVALLALLAPACWSGFAEVHVAAGDASAPGDRPAADRPLADAPGAPDGAQDAPSLDVVALDAPADASGPMDAPEDRAAPDVGDVVDVPAPEDARDAGGALDAVDASELRDVLAAEDRVEGGAGDVVDAPAPCGGACVTGETCTAGACGPWRLLGIIRLDRQFSASTNPEEAVRMLDRECAARHAGSRACFLDEYRDAVAPICAAAGAQEIISWPSRLAYTNAGGTGEAAFDLYRCANRTLMQRRETVIDIPPNARGEIPCCGR